MKLNKLSVFLFYRRDDAQWRRGDDNDDVADVYQNVLRDGGGRGRTGQPQWVVWRQSQPQQAASDVLLAFFFFFFLFLFIRQQQQEHQRRRCRFWFLLGRRQPLVAASGSGPCRGAYVSRQSASRPAGRRRWRGQNGHRTGRCRRGRGGGRRGWPNHLARGPPHRQSNHVISKFIQAFSCICCQMNGRFYFI